MENRRLLVDTSVIIEFLRKRDKKETILWKAKEKNCDCVVSAITVFELYPGAKTERHKKDLKILLKWMEIIPFTEKLAKKSAEIYLQLKERNNELEFRDIFIGATAIEMDIPVLTLNEKHFSRIPEVEIIDKDNVE